MKIREAYPGKPGGKNGSKLVKDLCKVAPMPSVEPVMLNYDYDSEQELAEALAWVYSMVLQDGYLRDKRTKEDKPTDYALYCRVKKIMEAPTAERTIAAQAAQMWLGNFERKTLESRRKKTFGGAKDAKACKDAYKALMAVYGFGEREMEYLRYFVCQARRDGSDPALNRALYLWSGRKMTGKTTVSKMIAGVLNGYSTWGEACKAGIMSDIPRELQFERFARPLATRCQCVVMDEGFTGKTTSKYYAKFKSVITSDRCSVEIKFGDTVQMYAPRNYIFTSNSDPSSIVADASERRLMSIEMRQPQQLSYNELWQLWRAYIVNVPDEEDVAKWYRDTLQDVKGEQGVQMDDVAAAFLADDFGDWLEEYTRPKDGGDFMEQAARQQRYQVSFPNFFKQFLSRGGYNYHVADNVIKEAVVSVFGEPKTCGRKIYYNAADIRRILQDKEDEEANEQRTALSIYEDDTRDEEDENENLPY